MQKNITESPLFNVLAFSIFWAIQIFVSKLGFIAGADVIPFTIQTSFFAILLLTTYILIFKKEKLKDLTKDVFLGLIIASAVHNGLGSFFSNFGISLTSAINAGFLVQFSTVTTSILAWLVLKEKMTTSKAITVTGIMFGTYFLITKGQLLVPHVGDILILLACLSWSTGNILIKKIMKSHTVDSDVITFLRPISGLPVFLGFISLSSFFPTQTQIMFQKDIFNFDFTGYALLNALFACLLWIFLNRTLKVASASYMTMMSSLTPALVALMAIVFLKESLIPIQWLGVIMIAFSGVVTQILKVDKH